MIIKNVTLETVCGVTSTLPVHALPEIAFAGRSNVGKSSLINALMERKSYARVSQSPGKTQTINYYNINKELYLVDLPGYGYAQVSKELKEKWGRLVERYLRSSGSLRACFLLVDIRRVPSDGDRLMYEWITGCGCRPIVIATKLDKIKRSQVTKQINGIRKGLDLPENAAVIPFSSSTRQGREEIWEAVHQAAEPVRGTSGEEDIV